VVVQTTSANEMRFVYDNDQEGQDLLGGSDDMFHSSEDDDEDGGGRRDEAEVRIA
jgi:hypothetical protein